MFVFVAPVFSAQEPENITLFGRIVLEPGVKVGDLLTIVVILVSVYSIKAALQKDRDIKQKEKADKVRNAAAKTIANLIRWRELTLSIFQDIDDIFIQSIKGSKEVLDTNEFANLLLENLRNMKKATCKKRLEEDKGIKYTDIYDYDPLVGMFFNEILAYMTNNESTMFNDVLLPGIKKIITQRGATVNTPNTPGVVELMEPVDLYVNEVQKAYESHLNNLVLSKLGTYLLSPILSEDDKNILETRKTYFDFSSMKIPPANPNMYLTYIEEELMLIPGEV